MEKINEWVNLILEGWNKIYEWDQNTFIIIWLIIGLLCVLLGVYVMRLAIQRFHMDISDTVWLILLLLGIAMIIVGVIVFFSFTMDTIWLWTSFI